VASVAVTPSDSATEAQEIPLEKHQASINGDSGQKDVILEESSSDIRPQV